MKILYVTTNYESVQQHLSEALIQNGIPTKVFCYNIRKDMYNYDLPEDVFFYNCPFSFRGPVLYLFRLRMIAKKCEKIAKQEKITCLHANKASGEGYICRYVAKKMKIPYVVSVRNADLNTGFLWKLPWLKMMVNKNIYFAKNIIFLGETYKHLFSKKLFMRIQDSCKNKEVVIPNGIDAFWHNNRHYSRDYKSIENRLLDRQVNLIFAGKINYNKNISAICKAKKALEEQGWTINITVVGKIEDPQVFDEIKDEINYFSAMPKESLIYKYRDADIFVMPSFTESFGLVYAEAMTQGLPVIYTRGQGFDGQFSEGEVGYSVNSGDFHELADKIEKICNNYSNISKRAVEASMQFNWQNVVSKVSSLYNS